MSEENNNSRLKIHETTKLTPYFSGSKTAGSASSTSLPLTYFDNFWLKFPPVERLFFYQLNHLNQNVFNSLILPKLKHSLSLTLQHYLPLAGHIMWPADTSKPSVCYFLNSEEDGVSLRVAESEADFNHLCGNNGIREAVELHPLVPQLYISDDKAEPIAIQITLFPNEGFSIGISSHHAVLDGKSSTMFFKSWAYLCKQLHPDQELQNPSLSPELTPCFDRSLIRDPKGLDVVYANNWLDFNNDGIVTRSLKVMPMKEVNSKLVRMTFELSPKDIMKLRNKVLSKVNENAGEKSKELHLSTYVLTCAHVFVCLVKALEEEEAHKSVMFGVTADCRSRLNPPLPVNYFGNCVGGHVNNTKASDLMGENGVAFVAEKLSESVKQLKGDVIEGSESTISRLMKIIKGEVKLRVLSVAGSNRFDVYGSDFGWGKPKKVEIVSIDNGAISLAESRDGNGGIEVGVALEKQQMEVFASLFFNGLKDV